MTLWRRHFLSVALALVGAALMMPVVDAGAASWRATIDGEARIGFTATQTGQPIEGRFERFQTEIAFEPDDLAASRAEVAIDMASARTGDPQKDAALPLPEWFDVANHPEARFLVRSFRRLDDDRFEATAKLTIRGATRDVVLPFTFTREGDRGRVVGALTIDRTDFGVGQGPWASDQWIAHPVTISIDLPAERHPPP